MKWIKDDINFDFMGARQKAFVLSGIVILASLVMVFTRGLNLGIDFKGGSSVIVAFKEAHPIDRDELASSIRSLVAEETGDQTSQVTVQDFSAGGGGTSEPVHRYLVYTEVTSLIKPERRDAIIAKIKQTFGDKTRIDAPSEGSDIFYLQFAEEANVVERVAQLRGVYKELGFPDTAVVADLENQLDIQFFREMDLLLNESMTAPESERERIRIEIENKKTLWEKKKAVLIASKADKRFTVTVQELRAKVTKRLKADFAAQFHAVESSTSVSPSVGKDLFQNGLLAILYAIIGILIYITVRFDVRFAPGAVAALVHDVIITMGIFAAFQIKFSLPIIAALLTIVGYSLNDTIVVLDRVRETFDQFRGKDLGTLLNKAINSTLSRTVLTSVTTGLVVLAIIVLGGGLIRDFAIALIIGIVVGTYSSIFVASPLVYYMDQYLKKRGIDPGGQGQGKGDKGERKRPRTSKSKGAAQPA